MKDINDFKLLTLDDDMYEQWGEIDYTIQYITTSGKEILFIYGLN